MKLLKACSAFVLKEKNKTVFQRKCSKEKKTKHTHIFYSFHEVACRNRCLTLTQRQGMEAVGKATGLSQLNQTASRILSHHSVRSLFAHSSEYFKV